MAQGGWDTGTWDAALWDSLPVTGNSATGGVGNLGTSQTAALTGNEAAGQSGTPASSITIAITGVQGTGQVGTESEVNQIPVTGVEAQGQVGSVSHTRQTALSGVEATGAVGSVGTEITISLSGVSATGEVGTVTASIQPILLDDTHDGDRQKKRFANELKEKERRKQQLIDAYEQLLEVKPEVASKIVAPFVQKTRRNQPTINFELMLADLNRVEALYKERQELDDEEVLLLL